MRTVRSQLDNLSPGLSGGPDSGFTGQSVRSPLGCSRQTDEIQRRIDALGGHPGHWSPEMYAPANMMPGYAPVYNPQTYGNIPMQHMYQEPNPYHQAAHSNFPNPAAAQGPELENIRASLDRLTSKMQSISRSQMAQSQAPANAPPSQIIQSDQMNSKIAAELAELRTCVHELSNARNGTDLEDIRNIIDHKYFAIEELIRESAGQGADPAVIAQAVEASHADIARQVEDLRKMLAAPSGEISGMSEAIASVHRDLADQIKNIHLALESHDQDGQTGPSSIEMRLEEITRAIVAISSGDQGVNSLERIEARISDVAKMVDRFSGSPPAGNPGMETPDLSDKLDAVQNALKEMDNRLSGLSPAGGSDLDGMAAQINRLSEKLDNMLAVSGGFEGNGEENSGVLGRLDELVERVGSNNSAAIDPAALTSLGDRLEQMAASIDRLSAPADPVESGSMLASLEDQMAMIVSQLNTMSSSPSSMQPVVERLSGIEDQLGASRDIAIEVASQAAEEAVKRTIEAMPAAGKGENSIEMETISALSEDLRRLHENTVNANSSNLQTFDAVKDTLTIMAERLGHIEAGMSSHASADAQTPLQAASADRAHARQDQQAMQVEADTYGMNAPDDTRHPSQASGMVSPEPREEMHGYSELPQVETPGLAMNEMPEALNDDPASADDAPLEPGSGGPDLAALVRQANERRKNTDSNDQPASGTDFIAAARRAAQAAAAEASIAGEAGGHKKSEEAGKGLLKSFPALLKKRRKVIILAAAAAILIAVAMPFAGKFLAGDLSIADNNGPAITSSENTGSLIEPAEVEEEVAQEIKDDAYLAAEVASSQPPQEVETAMVDTAADPVGSETHTGDLPAAGPAGSETVAFGSDAFKQAVASGDATALFEVGRRYSEGNGVEKNLAEAAVWYEKAAAEGLAPAQYIIGNFNEKGLGVTADMQNAARWYEMAASNGNIIAMHNLAVLHATPNSLSAAPDMEQAFTWFKAAAEYGVRDSQVNAGIFYTKGIGTPVDLIEAYKWFSVAAKAGDTDAASKMGIIGDALRPDQLEKAKAAAAAWRPATPDVAANKVDIPDSWKGGNKIASLAVDKDTVSKAQRMLGKLGFDAGPADGVMGKKTTEAIKAFQQRAGLPVTGTVNGDLMQALQRVSI